MINNGQSIKKESSLLNIFQVPPHQIQENTSSRSTGEGLSQNPTEDSNNNGNILNK